MVMAYKVVVANTFYVEAGSEAEARLRVIGDLAGIGSENMLVTEIGEEYLEGAMVC
jgi:hypothetical protein